jgi:transcriptional regulator with PAS, ATPase and Fis domain
MMFTLTHYSVNEKTIINGRKQMKKIIVPLMLLILLMPVASADIVNDLDVKVNEYNENADYLPSYLKSLLGDEVIKLVIVDDSGEEIYIKAVTENAYVTTFEEVAEDTEFDATMVIGASEGTVRSVMDSETPLETFVEAKDNGDIVIEPVGFVNNVTYTVANVVLKISQLLGLI